MICIGNQTSFAAATPMEPFEYAVANGFDAFEWFPDKHGGAGWDEADLTAALRAGIRDSARDAGIRSSVHARLAASPLHPDAYAWFWKDLELATDLGAVLLNIHLCHLQGLAAYAEGIRPLLRRTAEAGLALAIENMPEHSPEMFNELFARLRGLGGDPTAHVGMCLDLGHANLCAATQNRYLEFVDRLDPQVPIIHLHLHENWGDADSHVPLFTGPSSNDDSGIRGLIARLQRRRFAGSIILEQWPQPPSLLNEARDRLRRMLGATASEVQSPKSKVKAQATAGTVPGSAGGPASELPQGFAGELVAADRQRPSWREKLEWVGQALARETPPLTEEELGDIAVYLRFLGTGEIQCAEDGRHFRPAHHARLASRIQQQLARLETPAKAFLARRIYPWLPSSAAPFRRAEPLTRIRDIAHRNDIPAELKREIKHSLQNKLHRCAGPETWPPRQPC